MKKINGNGCDNIIPQKSQIMDYADILYLIVWYTVKRTKQKIRYDHCRIIPYITVWQMAISFCIKEPTKVILKFYSVCCHNLNLWDFFTAFVFAEMLKTSARIIRLYWNFTNHYFCQQVYHNLYKFSHLGCQMSGLSSRKF